MKKIFIFLICLMPIVMKAQYQIKIRAFRTTDSVGEIKNLYEI